MPCELVICLGRQITARSQPRSHVPLLKTLIFTDPTAHLPSTSGPCTGSGKNRERPSRKRVDRGPGGCVLITRPRRPRWGSLPVKVSLREGRPSTVVDGIRVGRDRRAAPLVTHLNNPIGDSDQRRAAGITAGVVGYGRMNAARSVSATPDVSVARDAHGLRA